MRISEAIYAKLVNQVPGIQERYHKKRNHVHGIGRASAWLYLIGMNLSYYVFHNRKFAEMEKFPFYEEKLLYSENSESSISYKCSPEELVKQLSEYDVISFDVFDTLILRPFSAPVDLFYLLAHKLDYPDFQRIRMEMEARARQIHFKKSKNYEVTLDEIYDLIEQETGIKKQTAMELEVSLEVQLCFANPYMKQVIGLLKEKKKKIVITSDMYLNTNQIHRILQNSGYPDFDAYYVSCDRGKSKSKGDLYELVKQSEEKKFGKSPVFAHVGDNEISDVEHSEKHGFKAFHYRNVNVAGEPYRPYDMSCITGSVYRGLVNAHIHNGLYQYSREYEYGYIYGGLFVTGYCRFIHQYVKNHGPDKLLFLARDGDVLLKAYNILYPEEMKRCEYVYWSRLAATKMAASYYKYDYFRRFLYHKVNQNYTLQQIFESMELPDMLQTFCEASKNRKESDELTDRNVEEIKNYLLKNWNQVLAHYEEQLEAGRQYFSKILRGSRKAVAIDIGWAGSGAITLNHIVNKIWHMDCDITGIIAGTNTCHNAEPDSTETYLQSGRLTAYLYSQRENRDIWKLHDSGKGHNLYWEMLLDAPSGSLKGFYTDQDGKWTCRFKKACADVERIHEVQKGILCFVKHWKMISENLDDLEQISGRDAYAPMVNIEREKNKGYMKYLLHLEDEMGI